MKKYTSAIIAIMILSSSPVQAEDIENSKDHPIISRYQGTEIKAYKEIEYDEYLLGIGPVKDGKVKTKALEGKITTIMYSADKKLSTLQILRNYESALNAQGFNKLFSCSSEDCGRRFPKQLFAGTSSEMTYLSADIFNMKTFRYLSGSLTKDDKMIYVSLLISKNKFNNSVFIGQGIVESTEMLTNQVTIDLSSLEQHIQNTGKATLHGIVFDHDSASLTKASSDTVKVLSQYLNKYPDYNYYVVGHTDNQGSYSYNLELSKNRAETIKNVLVQDGIKTNRLFSVGIAHVSPVTSNSDSQGRKQNRRVELVLVGPD